MNIPCNKPYITNRLILLSFCMPAKKVRNYRSGPFRFFKDYFGKNVAYNGRSKKTNYFFEMFSNVANFYIINIIKINPIAI